MQHLGVRGFKVTNRNDSIFELETMVRGIRKPKLHVEYYPSVVQYRFDLQKQTATSGVKWTVEVVKGCYGLVRGK